jgi:hypothetical protein
MAAKAMQCLARMDGNGSSLTLRERANRQRRGPENQFRGRVVKKVAVGQGFGL